jgi:MoaA/NifB/PqqE/SkfB family radical SAM enzyme
MKKEKSFFLLSNNSVIDENSIEWEICSKNEKDDDLYDYQEVECFVPKPKFKESYNVIEKFINVGMKTNIHFIYSKLTHCRAINVLKGKDVWEGKLPKGLNAIIFLLYKPAGKASSKPELVPINNMIKEFLDNLVHYMKNIYPITNVKVGVDSCLACRMMKFKNFNKLDQTSIDICESARMSAYISPTMNMMPCSFCNEEKYGVSLKDKKIRDVWSHHHNFLKFRSSLSKKAACPLGY